MWKSVGLAKLTLPFTDCGIDGPAPHWTLLDSGAKELTQALWGELPPPHTHHELGKDGSTPYHGYTTHQRSKQVIDAGEPTLRA